VAVAKVGVVVLIPPAVVAVAALPLTLIFHVPPYSITKRCALVVKSPP